MMRPFPAPRSYKCEALEIDLQARKRLLKDRGSRGIKAGVVDALPAPAVH